LHQLKKKKKQEVEPEVYNLWRLSNASGTITLKLEQEGKLERSKLDKNDVFFVETNKTLFIWVGSGADVGEKKNALSYAEHVLKQDNRGNCRISRVVEGSESDAFFKNFVN